MRYSVSPSRRSMDLSNVMGGAPGSNTTIPRKVVGEKKSITLTPIKFDENVA